MQPLMRQRIKYLVEYGELYPREEAASKNFVMRVALAVLAFEVALELFLLTLS